MELFKTKTHNYFPPGEGFNESEVAQSKFLPGSSADEDIRRRSALCIFSSFLCVCVSVCVPFTNFFIAQLFIGHLLCTNYWGSNG